MRLSAVMTAAGFLGVVLGAALIARWAVGLAVVADSVTLAVYGVLRDDGRGAEPSVRPLHEVPSLSQVLERARAG